jgi:hypothetical protein
MEGKHHCWPGIYFCEPPTTTHRFCFDQRTVVPIFWARKSESKNRQFQLHFNDFKEPVGFLKEPAGL